LPTTTTTTGLLDLLGAQSSQDGDSPVRMMYETTLVRYRPVSVRKARRKRDSKVAGGYHNTSRSPRSPTILTPDSSPQFENSQVEEEQQQSVHGPGAHVPDLHLYDFFDLTAAADDNIASSFFHNHNGISHLTPTSNSDSQTAIDSQSISPHDLAISGQDHSPLLTQTFEMSWSEYSLFSAEEHDYRHHPVSSAQQHPSHRSVTNSHINSPGPPSLDTHHQHQGYHQGGGYTFELSPSEGMSVEVCSVHRERPLDVVYSIDKLQMSILVRTFTHILRLLEVHLLHIQHKTFYSKMAPFQERPRPPLTLSKKHTATGQQLVIKIIYSTPLRSLLTQLLKPNRMAVLLITLILSQGQALSSNTLSFKFPMTTFHQHGGRNLTVHF
jgi:hypothetical protein